MPAGRSFGVLLVCVGVASCGDRPSAVSPSEAVEIPGASTPPVQAIDPPPGSAKPAAPRGTCKTRCLPNSDVEDTDENRNVLAFCERYRKGLESKDIPGLVALASPRYIDDGGTPDPDDDVDFAGLPAFFALTLGNLDKMKVAIHYRGVREENGKILVAQSISASYTFLAAPGKWQEQPPREAMLVLEREGRSFKILKGM